MRKTSKTKAATALVIASFLVIGSLSEIAEAKNYRYRKSFSVTGDGSNADASISYVGGVSTNTNHYRSVSFSGLRMANPFSYRVFKEMNSAWNFGEEAWSLQDRYFITDGNLWIHYGDSQTLEGWTTYSEYSTGNHRYLSYDGGAKKKKRKNSARKTYEFSVSGTESDADATSREEGSIATYYYRKVSVPEFKVDNLVDFRLYSRNDFPQGFDAESWMLEVENFFITDGYLYLAYGYKTGSNFYNFNDDPFRLFIYSDGKRKKNRLTKQYAKKYDFSVADDSSSADKVATYVYEDGYVSYEYYKKYPLRGAKMADFPNIQVMKKSSFAEGFSDEAWSPVNYVITNGYIWVGYGSKTVDPDGIGEYEDSASGEYRVFSYR